VDADPGKTCLGGGMHCSSASSVLCFTVDHHCFHCLTAHALFFTAVSRAAKGYGQAHKRSGSFAAETSLSLARSYDEHALKLALGSTGEFTAGLDAFVFMSFIW